MTQEPNNIRSKMRTYHTFEDLAVQYFGYCQSAPSIIPNWEIRYIKRVEKMYNAVKKLMTPIWDDDWESFVFERPTPSGYNQRRLLWSDGDNWVFGNEEGGEYATSCNLENVMQIITKWYNSKFIKK